MRGFLLCLFVAVAIGENYEPALNPKKTYEYKYEGAVNIGLGVPNLEESGVRIMCNVKVIGVSAQTFLLQVSDLGFEEFNGIPGRSSFSASPKLTKRIAAQLTKPFLFEYAKGRVGDIRAPAETSDTIVNIVRGILDFLQVTVKATQRVYELEEVSIHGLCQSTYVIVEDDKSKDLAITQTVDISKCREKAALYSGLAFSVVDNLSKERGESVISTVRYTYDVKPTEDGGLITRAQGLERQLFTPFNVKGGNSKVQALKQLVLLGVTDTAGSPPSVPMQDRGSLVYKFVNELDQMPILLTNRDDPVPKIAEIIKRLAKANIYESDSETSEDVVAVYQLLRVITLEQLEALWKQLSGNDEHRRWLLDMSAETTNEIVLKFLMNRFKAADVSANEAGQTLLVAVNHLIADAEVVELAKEFLSMPFSKSHPMLWNTIMFAYGSLVYKHCVHTVPCPVAAVQPLLDLASDSLTTGSTRDRVVALKALGNAGHPSSIKTIMRFLPGFAPTPVELPAPVLRAALQAMRHLAVRDPNRVQDITLSLFVQRELPTEIRILAAMILFETKPPMAMVSTVTTFLLKETDLDVASFTYSLMRSLSKSSTPDNHYLSIACNTNVKILAPKYARLSYRWSRSVHHDWFSDKLLMGTGVEVLMLKSASSAFPTSIIAKGKLHFIGRILQLLEIGVHAEGIKEMLAKIPGFKGDFSYLDILNVVQNWDKIPADKTLMSVYSRLFGQEWLYVDVKTDFVQKWMKAFSPAAGKESPVWTMIETLQKGMSWHWSKAFLVWETRYIQASTLGLPIEISKYYSSITAITVNAKLGANPPPGERLGQLLTSDLSLETDGYVGYVKNNFGFHGINTNLFQCGTEMRSDSVLNVPWKFDAKLNVKNMKLELDFPTLKKETELISINFNTYAVSRNIEDEALAKMTPLMPDEMVEQKDQTFNSNVFNSKTNMCAEASIYGLAICVDAEKTQANFIDEYPLSYFLGHSDFAIKLQPAKVDKPVDKIHIEINAGPGKHPFNTLKRLSKQEIKQASSDSSSSANGESESVNDATEPVFSVKAVSWGGQDKPDGYQAVVYHSTEAQTYNTQLIVSQVGEEANWKLCTDTNLDNIHGDAKMSLRWGAECQTYKISLNAATESLPGPSTALKAKLHWDNAPDHIKMFGKRIEEYVPGMAFLLGFYQKHESNPKQEVYATVVATSTDSMDVKLTFPELTVYQQAIPIPGRVPQFHNSHNYIDNATYASN